MSKTLQGKYAERLEKENQQLKEKINKAIEKINESEIKVNSYNKKYSLLTLKLSETFQGEELLEILGGKE